MVAVERGKVRITTRNGIDASARYPELAGLAGQLDGHAALLDGELVVFDERGRPSFERHQQRMHVSSPTPTLIGAVPAVLCVFDLLWWDGQSLVDELWTARRERIEALDLRGPSWQTPPVSVGDPAPVEAVVAQLDLEGLIAKRVDSRYTPGKRSTAWTKVKEGHRQEFVVGGWLAGSGSRDGTVGSLLIGYYEGEALRYAGRVGSGFDGRELSRLRGLLAPLTRATNPFAGPVPDHPAFVDPVLVVEVRFTEWTSDGALRHPVYLGQRLDKPAPAVTRLP
jgi:bifunctional non-homologous end joining protein LigD